jgi:hypothetical protein
LIFGAFIVNGLTWTLKHLPWLGLFKASGLLTLNMILLPYRSVKGVLWAFRSARAIKKHTRVWSLRLISELRHPRKLLRWWDKVSWPTWQANVHHSLKRWASACQQAAHGLDWRFPAVGAVLGGLVFVLILGDGLGNWWPVVQPDTPIQTLALLDETGPQQGLDGQPAQQLLTPMVPRALSPQLAAVVSDTTAVPSLPVETTAVDQPILSAPLSAQPLPTLTPQPVQPHVTTTALAGSTHVVIRQQASDGKPAKVTDIQVSPSQAVVVVINN